MSWFRTQPGRVFWGVGLTAGIVLIGILATEINDLLDFESNTELASHPASPEAGKLEQADLTKGTRAIRTSPPGEKADLVPPRSLTATNVRTEFLRELQKLLDAQGDQSAPAISELCRRSDRELTPKMRFALDRIAILGDDGELKPDLKILMYRNAGLPEPLILEELAKASAGASTKAKGAVNAERTLVQAARSLLAVPLIRPEVKKER